MLFFILLLWYAGCIYSRVCFDQFLSCYNKCVVDQWKVSQRPQYWMVSLQPTYTFLKYVADHFEQTYTLQPSYSLRIPKIIHQIWLGGPVPEYLRVLQQTWCDHNGWEYMLWTEQEIEELGLYNKELYDHASNYGEKSDLARYEILYRYGGLYVDMDCKCLDIQRIEELHMNYDLFVGLEPFEFFCIVGNAVIGSIAGHPALKRCIEGLTVWQEQVYSFCMQQNIPRWAPTCVRTGPGYLSNVLLQELCCSTYKNIILPPTFFYPGIFPETTCYSEFTCIHHYFCATWVLQ